jgi:hypothetical protein
MVMSISRDPSLEDEEHASGRGFRDPFLPILFLQVPLIHNIDPGNEHAVGEERAELTEEGRVKVMCE